VDPGPVIVVTTPGNVESEITVEPGPTIVVTEPGRVDKIVVPGSVVVTAGSVSVVGAGVRVEIELIVEVTVEAGSVIVVKEPEIEVVTVEAGSVVVKPGK